MTGTTVDLDLGIRDAELLAATLPPERRGVGRDGVKLLLTNSLTGAVRHEAFRNLPDHLKPGDLLVLNDSGTLPASVPVRRERTGELIRLHLAPKSRRGTYLAEPRTSDGRHPLPDVLRQGEILSVDAGRICVGRRYDVRTRLWSLKPETGLDLGRVMTCSGDPIQYPYVAEDLPLEDYQTVYAGPRGSSEMPSAGRAFTRELLDDLARGGVEVVTVTLHTSLSSHEVEGDLKDHVLLPEPYWLPDETARAIRGAMKGGRRVIACGTTVVRALASAEGPDGRPRPGHATARAMVAPGNRPSCLAGLLTGLHTPRSSHLALLEAFISPEHLRSAYRAAIEARYLWHEFGDLQLILPGIA